MSQSANTHIIQKKGHPYETALFIVENAVSKEHGKITYLKILWRAKDFWLNTEFIYFLLLERIMDLANI